MKSKTAKSKKSFNIILGVAGGIAAYKCCELVRLFIKQGHSVRVVLTKHGSKFVTPLTFETLSGNRVYTNLFSKTSFSTEHITLSKWGDILLIAPATANIIGKFAGGIADDILSTLFLSFAKPVVIAPAMHSEMYGHKIVVDNTTKLKNLGVHFIDAGTGELASGDTGQGRLADPKTINAFTLDLLGKKKDLEGLKVLITAGPTREYIDPVRFISSPSSGKMGVALAREAAYRGAQVTFIHGPIDSAPEFPGKKIKIVSAREMDKAVTNNRNCDIFISAAAVSDWTPRVALKEKIKKSGKNFGLELNENPDIIANFSKKYGADKIVVGFAAETTDLIKNAKSKIESKKLDMIVANDVASPDSGFGTQTDRATIIYKNGRVENLGLLDKRTLAGLIFDRITGIAK